MVGAYAEMLLKKYWKYTAILLCLLIVKEGRRPLYQLLWGRYTGQQIELGGEEFAVFPDTDIWQRVEISGYVIDYQIRRKYKVNGRVVFVDWNDGIINTWYHAAANEGVKLYNAVSSVDVSVIHGATAEDGNWQKLKFKHEERGLSFRYQYADNPVVKHDEINNNHVIPATTAVRRAIAVMKVGEIVEMEGYLMDWKGTGKFSWFDIQTATEPGELHSKQLYGGVPGAGLCRQFYVTKVCFDGYCFE